MNCSYCSTFWLRKKIVIKKTVKIMVLLLTMPCKQNLHQLFKSSVECTVNDTSVRPPRKTPSTSTDIVLSVISVENTKAAFIICNKESKSLRPLKSRYKRLLIVVYMSLVVDKRILRT